MMTLYGGVQGGFVNAALAGPNADYAKAFAVGFAAGASTQIAKSMGVPCSVATGIDFAR